MNAILLRSEYRMAALMAVFTIFPGTYGIYIRMNLRP
jgi:hypothetical protein